MSVKSVAWLGFGLLLAGCVAPEEPAPVRRAPAAASAAPVARPDLEPAPIPNRRLGAPSGDSIIKIQK